MRLASILPPDVVAPPGAANLSISGLTADSRQAGPGIVFAALAGAKADGARFAADAVARGAPLVLAGTDTALPALSVPVLRAEDPRRALALMSAAFYGAQPATTIAITGTNGKTSVAEFTRQIFALLGRKAASLGTIGLVKPDGAVYGSLTTPDPVTLHRTLAELANEGVTHLAFEASSHGLDQRRLDGVRLAAGAFLNLGRDHLDYHQTIEDYLAAKLRLISTLLEDHAAVVVNADGERASDAIAAARARGLRLLTTGRNGDDLRLQALAPDGFAQRLSVAHQDRRYDLKLPLIGAYQAGNALVAAAIAIATGEPPHAAIEAIAGLKGVNGRLDILGEHNGGLVVVDYAHKPEALAAALDALRPFASGRLVCVFGCGGDRDKGKRPIMGGIAAAKADIVIVTDDNPRTEAAATIRSEILAAAPGAREIGDRARAIGEAIAMMGKGDVVLIAGKGHETGQIVGTTVTPFSDHEAAREALGRS